MILNLIYEIVGPTFTFITFYLFIFIMSTISYKLGFAHKLPILKEIIIIFLLAIGSIILTILAFKLPMAEILVIMVIFLLFVRLRMTRSSNNKEVTPNDKG